MQVYFCDRCSCRVTEGELDDGSAYRFGSLVFCQSCWQTNQVKSIVRKSTALMAAVQEGGAGASTGLAGFEGEQERRRKSPASGVRRVPRHKHRRHPTPTDGRLPLRSHVDSGKYHPAEARGLSNASFALIVFGAVAVTTFLLVGAAFLLA